MTLLLLDLDDTLVDRGRIFGQWVADFTRPNGVSDQDLAWIAALDGGGLTPREDFFAGVVQRLGLCAAVPVGVRKPEPRIFELAAERAGVRLDDGWMIGDNPEADIGGGRGAGLRTVWLSRGRTWEHDGFAPDQQALDPASAIRQVVRPTGRG